MRKNQRTPKTAKPREMKKAAYVQLRLSGEHRDRLSAIAKDVNESVTTIVGLAVDKLLQLLDSGECEIVGGGVRLQRKSVRELLIEEFAPRAEEPKAVKRNGKGRESKWTQGKVDKFKDLYLNSSLSMDGIAKELGLSDAALYKKRKDMNLPQRHKQQAPLTDEGMQSALQMIAESQKRVQGEVAADVEILTKYLGGKKQTYAWIQEHGGGYIGLMEAMKFVEKIKRDLAKSSA